MPRHRRLIAPLSALNSKSGAVATLEIGTAVSSVRHTKEDGYSFKVGETEYESGSVCPQRKRRGETEPEPDRRNHPRPNPWDSDLRMHVGPLSKIPDGIVAARQTQRSTLEAQRSGRKQVAKQCIGFNEDKQCLARAADASPFCVRHGRNV